MNTVGPDTRLQYYRLPGAAVLGSLRSHPMGLTNSEATRRLEANGPNRIPDVAAPLPWLQHGTVVAVGLLIMCLVATMLQESTLAWTLLALAIGAALLTIWSVRMTPHDPAPYSHLIPPRARVLRNGDVHRISTRQLVVGDIVQLEAGDIVPADLRLLTEDDLIINDSSLLGGSTHTRKFTHAIASTVPVIARNNLVYAASRVVGGHASGIVIATGTQTELGRMAILDRAARQQRRSELRTQQRRRERWLGAALFLFLFVLALCWQAGLTLTQTADVVLLIAAAVVPVAALGASLYIRGHAVRALARVSVRTNTTALARLSKVDMILLHDRALAPQQFAATRLLVGRSHYSVGSTGHRPIGDITDDKGSVLSGVQTSSLAPFFTAGVLSTHTTVANRADQPDQWQVHGDAVEAALVTLARKAHLSVERLQVDYEPVAAYPYDHGRKLASSVRQHDDQLTIFVHGTAAAVMAQSKKIWDHGHVRALSERDRERCVAFVAEEEAAGHICVALAYRPMQRSKTIPDLEEAENALILLGIVSCSLEARGVVAQLPTALPAQLHVARLSTHPYAPHAITSRQLRKLSDASVLRQLESSTAHFANLTSEDLLRLVEIAKQAGHTVGMSSLSLSDEPAAQRADVSIACSVSSGLVRDRALVLVDAVGVSPLMTLFAHAQAITAQLRILRRTFATDVLALALVICISIRALLYANTPAALTTVEVIWALLLAQAVPLLALTRVAAWRRARAPSPEIVIFALTTAALTYSNFLVFFWRHNIGAAFIDASSSYYLQATTVALLTYLVCQWLHAAFEQYDGARVSLGNRLLTLPLLGAAVLAGVAYLPPLHSYFGTQALDASDWLTILLAAVLYIGVRLVQRHTRQHTRAEVLALTRKPRLNNL